MGGLPLRFKHEGLIERYQMEGMDPSDRSFNRTVFVNRMGGGYVGKVIYEAFVVEGAAQPTPGQPLGQSRTNCSDSDSRNCAHASISREHGTSRKKKPGSTTPTSSIPLPRRSAIG